MESTERENLARQYVQSAEHWLRRLIHYKLAFKYGNNYLTQSTHLSNNKIRKPISNKVHHEHYEREIDATSLEQAIDIVLNPTFFKAEFEDALKVAYPFGHVGARHFLDQLRNIRNDISHGRGCSARQLEKARCYTNDLAESIQAFFRGESVVKEYDVPMIVKYVDSLGNTHNLTGVSDDINNRIIDWRRQGHGDLRPGDVLTAEVEIDQSYPETDYDVFWQPPGSFKRQGRIAEIKIDNSHVGLQFEFSFEVKTHKDWHRQYGLDDRLAVIYRVLPPV